MAKVLDLEDCLRLGPMWVGDEEDFPDAEDTGDMDPMVTSGMHPTFVHMGLMRTHMVHLPIDGEVPTDLVTLRTLRCTRGTHIV